MDLNQKYNIVDKLDFRNNKSDLIYSYIFRFIGIFFFGFLYYRIYNYQYGYVDFADLINIEIKDVSAIVSVLLLLLNILFVLYLHELIHALVFFITNTQKPNIGYKGWVIYAAAPNQIITKKNIIVNALSPFVVISIIGFVLIAIAPLAFVSWIFIPTLINAAASGGDFILIYFVLKQRKGVYYNDKGDIIYAIEFNTK